MKGLSGKKVGDWTFLEKGELLDFRRTKGFWGVFRGKEWISKLSGKKRWDLRVFRRIIIDLVGLQGRKKRSS